MTRCADVVVVGGGIVGLCSALAAADRGLEVTIADDAQPGAASRASAGMLAPSLGGLPKTVRDLATRARDMYPAFLARLVERSGTDIALDRGGILELADPEADLDALRSREVPDAHVLTNRELRELEPELSWPGGALHHPLDGAVDNVALMEALWIAAGRHRRIEITRSRVEAVDVSGQRPCVTFPAGDTIEAETLVVATGAWSLLPGTFREVPVRPLKGELLTLDRVPLRHVVYGAAGYLVPRGGTLVVGATSEEAGFDANATEAGRRHLRQAASALVASLRSAAMVAHWAGLRPASPDGLPILGRDREFPALVHVTGFSRNGILLGPWAGDAVGAMIATDGPTSVPLEFDPCRFWN